MDYGLAFTEGIGLSSAPIQTVITGFIRSLLGFIGFILVLQIMYAGYLLLTHGGKEEARQQAVAALTQSVVGFVIITSATSMVRFVVDAVVNAQVGYL